MYCSLSPHRHCSSSHFADQEPEAQWFSMRSCSLQSCPTLRDPVDRSRRAPLTTGFSRQEHWRGLPCPPPGDLPDPGIKPSPLKTPALAGGLFTTSATREALSAVETWPLSASSWDSNPSWPSSKACSSARHLEEEDKQSRTKLHIPPALWAEPVSSALSFPERKDPHVREQEKLKSQAAGGATRCLWALEDCQGSLRLPEFSLQPSEPLIQSPGDQNGSKDPHELGP